ncbi:MAG TPA: DUF1577 domain-containing protein [Spirochaetota bacterium]|nr:DUF1577 domain-containing protein [Spirochaetota bacterium]HPI88566.1 DUF1577 domain-containing protein [Spirochaetota bacterium]HPR48207.1 DUF1577 domain-containing protein [Spirochaetota bacterium]
MIEIRQRKNREFESFKTVDDVINILKSQFTNRKLYIKYSVDKTEVTINEYLDDKSVMVVTDQDYKPEGNLVIYGLSDKYIEVDMDILDEITAGYYKCRIKSARRAIKGRRDLRFKVNPDEVVATNFRVSKHTIDLSGFKMPTSIKVLLDQFQGTNSKMSDIVKVDVFDFDNKDPLFLEIRKTGKTLFIPDTAETDSYKALNEDFVDVHALMENQVPDMVKKNIERGYRSIIIVPIIYITENESSIPFAYIQVISKSEQFGIEKVLELKDHSFKLVDRIRDANTILIPVHQHIIDVSRGGAKLKITDSDLKKYIIKSKGFIFDIVFKLQAPITIYGDIKVTYADEDKNIFVGVDFEGNSSRKDEMKRFYSILKPMEADYKAKLIKQLKNKK